MKSVSLVTGPVIPTVTAPSDTEKPALAPDKSRSNPAEVTRLNSADGVENAAIVVAAANDARA